jgi:hypothetical protein
MVQTTVSNNILTISQLIPYNPDLPGKYEAIKQIKIEK